MKRCAFLVLLALTACEGTRHPTLGGENVHKMSSDTLCYRYAYAKSNEELKAEVAARNLDCREILDSQTPVGDSRW